ncbi:SseB family protein [Streptomyces sp. ODS28]|uniref:SseB family protein n=1 Tax=Streptomyces sp. ODS28 TaxID=3136688 RepID=UPI0031E9FDA8
MALKNIPDSPFAEDDGSADPALAEALTTWNANQDDDAAEKRVLTALRTARLLVPVVAVLGEEETDEETGLRREKSSDMAVPTLTAPGGRKALPAFTSTDALARWREDARPVAVPLHQALQALAHEGADTLVLDLAGPVPYQLTGPALYALAEGRNRTSPLTDPAVTEALHGMLAAEPDVAGAHLAPGGSDADATLALALVPEADARGTVRRLATALAENEALRSRLERGLSLALLPPETRLPENAFYLR